MFAMKTIERIKQFIDYKQLALSTFDSMIGAANAYIGKQIKRNSSIGADVIETIISVFPDLNITWLMTGKGDMINNTLNYEDTPNASASFTDENEEYSMIPPALKSNKGKKIASPTASPTHEIGVKSICLTPQIITVDSDANENIVYIPIKAAAGYLNGYNDQSFIEKLPSFSLPGLNNSTYRAFEVDGDSMWPTLENKEMIIGQWVEKIDYIREDRVHILVTKNDGIIVKRLLNRVDKYGYIIAKSDAVNDRNLYPNIEVYPDDILEIWYAVWHGGFNFKSPGDLWKRQNNLEADLTDIMRRLKQAGL